MSVRIASMSYCYYLSSQPMLTIIHITIVQLQGKVCYFGVKQALDRTHYLQTNPYLTKHFSIPKSLL